MCHFDPEPYYRRITRPPIRPGSRIPTRALLITEDGQDHLLSSGTDDEYFAHAVQLAQDIGFVDRLNVPDFAAHVEMKAAIWMRSYQRPDVRLVTNGVTCVGPLGCNTALSGLPPVWCQVPPDPSSPPMIVAYFRRDHDEAPAIVYDRRGILDLIHDLADHPFDHSLAALYLMNRRRNRVGLPDHELRIGVDAERNRAALRYMGKSGTWQSQGWRSDRDEVCFYYMGNDTPFSRTSEISLDEAADAIEMFLGKQGDRPENIAWTPIDPPSPISDQSWV